MTSLTVDTSSSTSFDRYLRIIQRRYDILEARDVYLRAKVVARGNYHIGPAAACVDMCPEKERYLRQLRKQISVFEVVKPANRATNQVSSSARRVLSQPRAVKEYSRSAADKEEALPHELRTLSALERTVDYLVVQIMGDVETLLDEGKYGEYYNFVWSRTRSIRKDMAQQQRHGKGVQVEEAEEEEERMAAILEKCVRWHIFCSHHLCHLDPSLFDPKLNNEHLTKSLQALKQLYTDIRTKRGRTSDGDFIKPARNEPEFQAYIILLNLDRSQGDIVPHVASLTPAVYDSAPVKFAFRVSDAFHNGDYVRFFSLLKRATFLTSCLLHRYFFQVRVAALDKMGAAYRYLTRNLFPIDLFARLLFFGDMDHTRSFLDYFGLTYDGSHVFLEPMSGDRLMGDGPAAIRTRELFVEAQVAGEGLADLRSIIYSGRAGRPVPHVVTSDPTSSFDETRPDGPYVGYPPLAEFWNDSSVEPVAVPTNTSATLADSSLTIGSREVETAAAKGPKRSRTRDEGNVRLPPTASLAHVTKPYPTFTNYSFTRVSSLPHFSFTTGTESGNAASAESLSDKRAKIRVGSLAWALTNRILSESIRSLVGDYARALLLVRKATLRLAQSLAIGCLDEIVREIVDDHRLSEEGNGSTSRVSISDDETTLSTDEETSLSQVEILLLPDSPESSTITNELAISIYRKTLTAVVFDQTRDTLCQVLHSFHTTPNAGAESVDGENYETGAKVRAHFLARRYYEIWRTNCTTLWDRRINILRNFPLAPAPVIRSAADSVLPIPYIDIPGAVINDNKPVTENKKSDSRVTNTTVPSQSDGTDVMNIFYKVVFIIVGKDREIAEFCLYQLFPYLGVAPQGSERVSGPSLITDLVHPNVLHYQGRVSSKRSKGSLSYGKEIMNYKFTFLMIDETNVPIYTPEHDSPPPNIQEPLRINDQTILDAQMVCLIGGHSPEIGPISRTLNERLKSCQLFPASQTLFLYLEIGNRKLDQKFVNPLPLQPLNTLRANNFQSLLFNLIHRDVNFIPLATLQNLRVTINGRRDTLSLHTIKVSCALSASLARSNQHDIPWPPYVTVQGERLVDYLYDGLCRSPLRTRDPNLPAANLEWDPRDLVAYFNDTLLPAISRTLCDVVSRVPQWPPLDFLRRPDPHTGGPHPHHGWHRITDTNSPGLVATLTYLRQALLQPFPTVPGQMGRYLENLATTGRYPPKLDGSGWRDLFTDIFEARIAAVREKMESSSTSPGPIRFILLTTSLQLQIPVLFPKPRLPVRSAGPVANHGAPVVHGSPPPPHRNGARPIPSILSTDNKRRRGRNRNGSKNTKKAALIDSMNERVYELNFQMLKYKMEARS